MSGLAAPGRVVPGAMGIDRNSVVELLLRERVRLTSAAAVVVRDVHAADDVFQQVVLAALEQADAFREPGHVVAWALRAARHRAIDLARRRHVRTLDADALDAMEAHWASLPDGQVSARVEALERCLAKLPARAREVLRLRYGCDLDCGAVARRLRRSVDAVYQALSRLHRRLRGCVEGELRRAGQLAAEEANL